MAQHSAEQDFHDEFYETGAHEVHGSPAWALVRARHIRFITSQIPSHSQKRVLSLGCGNGSVELKLSPHFAHIEASDCRPAPLLSPGKGRRQRAASMSTSPSPKPPRLAFQTVHPMSSWLSRCFII